MFVVTGVRDFNLRRIALRGDVGQIVHSCAQEPVPDEVLRAASNLFRLLKMQRKEIARLTADLAALWGLKPSC
jgi:hypothetical protein